MIYPGSTGTESEKEENRDNREKRFKRRQKSLKVASAEHGCVRELAREVMDGRDASSNSRF